MRQMLQDKIIYCKDAKKELQDFIKDWWELIIPFEVHQGISFQIKITKKQFESLDEKIRNILRFQSLMSCEYQNDGTDVYEAGSEELRLWQEEHFWSYCNAYIFDFTSDDSYELHTRCEYGYEGLEKSFDIIFFNEYEFPPIISRNMGCIEREVEGSKHFNDDFSLEINENG